MENKILTTCYECKKIKLNENSWISEEKEPDLYKKLNIEYKNRLSHGLCPTCGEIKRKELEVD